MKKNILFLSLIILCISGVSAQTIDSMMGIYADNFQQEKIHLHFDKSIYNKGEIIWFKAYIMTGTDLSYLSKNLFVDWFDNQGKLLSHTAAPIFESSARGQFVIPEKYNGKFIHAKAYTTWMLNFDTAFLYNRDLRVDQPTAAGSKAAKEKPSATIQFFPESGNMIDGIVQRIAFLAVNQYGIPVSATGILKNSKGEQILSFSTAHDGMGYFLLQIDPAETYVATWVDEYGIDHTTSLPTGNKSPATMSVRQSKDKVTFIVTRTPDANNLKTMNVIGHMNQYELFRARVNLENKTANFGTIPLNGLPTGVLQITLFDSNWTPIGERVVFVNNNKYRFEPTLKIVEKNLSNRAKNKIDIVLEDTVLSNMSIAITDAGLLTDSSNTIISQMLLSGDIRGYIQNPAYYFSSEADSVIQHLDLVMLTHGWRRFNWEMINKNKEPVITKAKDTDYLQIKGRVYGKIKTDKPNQSINLILHAKDSSTNFLTLPISPEGNFLQKDVSFYDTVKIYYSFNGDKKLASKAEVSIENGLIPAPANLLPAVALSPMALISEMIDTPALERNRTFYNEKIKLDKMSAIAVLEEIKLRSKAKSPAAILDEKYTSGLFSGGDAREFDIVNDPFGNSAANVFNYLQGKVAGLSIMDVGGQTQLSWRGGTPDVFLNEIHTQVDVLRSLSMSDVAYVKVFRPPFFGSFGGGAGGAIAVYTRKGSDAKFSPGAGLNFKALAGYNNYKEFYNPDYSLSQETRQDIRTTLYWNPFILTDKTIGVYHIQFFNNDFSKRLRIVLEGMNSNGKLTRIEKVIE